jgi:hypothetical protein
VKMRSFILSRTLFIFRHSSRCWKSMTSTSRMMRMTILVGRTPPTVAAMDTKATTLALAFCSPGRGSTGLSGSQTWPATHYHACRSTVAGRDGQWLIAKGHFCPLAKSYVSSAMHLQCQTRMSHSKAIGRPACRAVRAKERLHP